MTERDLALLDDSELVCIAREDRAGEEARRAASVLLERYRERVYLWCYRIVRDHEQALDLAQDSLLKAYRGIAGYEGRSCFATWLFVIARNHCLSVVRRPSPLFDEDEEGIERVADPAPDPSETLEKRLDEESVLALVRRHLDPLEREAIWLRCYEGLPVEEITRLLAIDTASGARGILQRARRKLRAALEDGAKHEAAALGRRVNAGGAAAPIGRRVADDRARGEGRGGAT